jgi:hypothetical protein
MNLQSHEWGKKALSEAKYKSMEQLILTWTIGWQNQMGHAILPHQLLRVIWIVCPALVHNEKSAHIGILYEKAEQRPSHFMFYSFLDEPFAIRGGLECLVVSRHGSNKITGSCSRTPATAPIQSQEPFPLRFPVRLFLQRHFGEICAFWADGRRPGECSPLENSENADSAQWPHRPRSTRPQRGGRKASWCAARKTATGSNPAKPVKRSG